MRKYQVEGYIPDRIKDLHLAGERLRNAETRKEAEEVAAEWRDKGYTRVSVYRAEGDRWVRVTDRPLTLLQAVEEATAIHVPVSDGATVHHVPVTKSQARRLVQASYRWTFVISHWTRKHRLVEFAPVDQYGGQFLFLEDYREAEAAS